MGGGVEVTPWAAEGVRVSVGRRGVDVIFTLPVGLLEEVREWVCVPPRSTPPLTVALGEVLPEGSEDTTPSMVLGEGVALVESVGISH